MGSSESTALADGLVLRHGRRADAAAVADLVLAAHHAAGEPETGGDVWVRDLMERPHPTMSAADVFVVEDTRSGALVSTLNLIPQTWTYGGVPFGVGRVELVATRPDHQRRGLVRQLMAAAHAHSAQFGHLVQAITGIPFFYRQFGYELALPRGGGVVVHRSQVPRLATGAPVRVRPATPEDLPALMPIERAARQRSLVACERDAAAWRYELDGRTPGSMLRDAVLALECGGRVVGFACLGSAGMPGTRPPPPLGTVSRFEVAAGASWVTAAGGLLRQLTGLEASALPNEHRGYEELRLQLGEAHPACAAAGAAAARRWPTRAWYLRVADVAGFLNRVAPVLEARLAAAPAARHDCDLTLSFFRSGVRLHLRGGSVQAEAWRHGTARGASATFPDLTFLHLLFGHRGLADLEYAFPDCLVFGEGARLVLNALFPKASSSVWPLG